MEKQRKSTQDNIIGKGFDKRPENINKKGRPKKLVSHINTILEGEGYTPVAAEQIKEAYLRILNLPFYKIKEMAKTESQDFPFLYKLVAKEMLGKRGLEMLDRLLDRALGKPVQALDHTTKGSVNVQISEKDAKL